MKIPPENKTKVQDLNFRLRLDIQFDREAKLAIPNIADFYQSTNGIRYEDKIDDKESGIDIDFEIQQTNGKEPSTANLTLWNITNDSFNQIANYANAFELYCAEGNDDWGLIFRGTPYFSSQKKAIGGDNKSRGFLKKEDAVGGENDIATEITLIDSLHSFDSAVISKSYQGTVSSQQIIHDCAAAMGIFMGDEADNYPEMNNYVARGKVRTILREICGKIGCKYIIDNGVLHLFNGNKQKIYGFLFNGENSTKPQAEQNNNQIGYHFETKLLPSIRVGHYCKCEFDVLSGVKEIYKCVKRGNNYGTIGLTEVWVK